MEAPNSRGEMKTEILQKVEEVIAAITKSTHVDQVICALHSISVLLFPIDFSLLSGVIDQSYRNQILGVEIPSATKREGWWQVFYRGAAFPLLARFLLFDVACNWLPCFPYTAQKLVYDVFFVKGHITEVVQTLVPSLSQKHGTGHDISTAHSNIERLLVAVLLEGQGMLHIAREFDGSLWRSTNTEQVKQVISRMAQLVASIPDKVQLRALSALSSHKFFKEIIIQLLGEADRRDPDLLDGGKVICDNDLDLTLHFFGETFARICRRGYVDILLSEVTPRMLIHVRSFISSRGSISSLAAGVFEANPGSQFWLKMMETIKDPYTVERILEQLFVQLATECASDNEAYWIIWILFHRSSENQISVRTLFIEKFLLWKVLPLCCLRWILQFGIFGCPPHVDSRAEGNERQCLIDTAERLTSVWSKQEFVQSATLEQQAYVTAAIGLLLEEMSKEELDKSVHVMHSILQGVSCRLESPTPLVRKMASSIALAFSKVVDPKNPLYLDDSLAGEKIDWEFGFNNSVKGTDSVSNSTGDEAASTETSKSMAGKVSGDRSNNGAHKKGKEKTKKLLGPSIIDPDEIIDPATLGDETSSDDNDDDNLSETSDSSSDSSLQPYDLSDDDTDLKRKISQLVDVVGALRKTDDPDGVERALEVAEKLVRASPDELKFVASDLVRTLVQVRCSDMAVEGEEDSAEEKRKKALIALVVTSPNESLDPLHKLLYSPNVDISQRVMILDIMTEAAQELAEAKVMKLKPKQQPLIATIGESQPWFLPSNTGPFGSGSWKEVSGTASQLNLLNLGSENVPNWTTHYERELPARRGQVKRGKTRQWSNKSANLQENMMETTQNKFPVYAAAFMLPAMLGFDKKRHGVDLLGRDFIVLGKLIHMLGVCIKCTSMHPEATALAPPLLDMLQSRAVCGHAEAYVRKAALFAASCILIALPPSYVASALVEGNTEISQGLEWVRTWAIRVMDADSDKECYSMAMVCLQLHSEMALQASRAMETADRPVKPMIIGLPSSNLSSGMIKIPRLNVDY